MVVNWGRELGIDVEALKREHPSHPDQLKNHKEIARAGERYWAYDRMLAQAGLTREDMAQAQARKVPNKKGKLRPYVFTEAQLAIARRSLDAKDSM
jgi:hypothetical protein